MKSLFIITLLFLASCTTTKLTKSYIERIDTVYVKVPTPSYSLREFALLKDTVIIEDARLSIKLIKLGYSAEGDSLIVEAIIKQDTLTVPVLQKTIEKSELKTESSTNHFERYLVLIAAILLLILILRFVK